MLNMSFAIASNLCREKKENRPNLVSQQMENIDVSFFLLNAIFKSKGDHWFAENAILIHLINFSFYC